jgi:hypothetical protein
MTNKLEGEVKRIKAPSRPVRKKPNDPALYGAKVDRARTKARRKSPLHTTGGTPIIERPPEG